MPTTVPALACSGLRQRTGFLLPLIATSLLRHRDERVLHPDDDVPVAEVERIENNRHRRLAHEGMMPMSPETVLPQR